MTDIKIKRYADKENLKKLVKYSRDTFADKSEINEKFYTKEQIDSMLESGSSEIDTKLTSKANTSDLSNYYTKEQIDTMLESGSGGGGTGGDLSNYYTKSEVDNLLSNIGSGTEGGDDAQGGLSFYNVTERAPGFDGTSQMNIAEDADTVEDE